MPEETQLDTTDQREKQSLLTKIVTNEGNKPGLQAVRQVTN